MAAPSLAQVTSRQTIRVLFIGNSYTYYNNLGDIIAGIAAADPRGPIIMPALSVHGGATLKWHLENGSAIKQLQAGGWDYLVLQEHSLLGGDDEDEEPVVGDVGEFFDSVREWVRRSRGVGATPVLYMTWARRDPASEPVKMQKQIADAYLSIGRELDVKVSPVGLAWEEARRRLRTIDLHIWDGSHPTAAGSYLAACLIYSTLTGRSPLGAPAVVQGRPTVVTSEETVVDPSLRVPLVDLPDATAAALQEIAWTIARQVANDGGPARSLVR
jgi:hypothetical protein